MTCLKHLIEWIVIFFVISSNRQQFVQVIGSKSDLLESWFGLPQGSIFGSVLFILYVNDFLTSLPMANKTIYFDDNTLLLYGTDGSLQSRATTTILDLQKWLIRQNPLNRDKTFFLQFLPHNRGLLFT